MKKEYKKPVAGIIEFVPEDDIMSGDSVDGDDDNEFIPGGGGSGSVEDW